MGNSPWLFGGVFTRLCTLAMREIFSGNAIFINNEEAKEVH